MKEFKFDPEKPIPFGKYKGKTINEIYDMGEKAQGWLIWLIDQPVETNKYAKSNAQRNEYIRELLSYGKTRQVEEPKKEEPKDKLDTIIKNQEKIYEAITNKGWDE